MGVLSPFDIPCSLFDIPQTHTPLTGRGAAKALVQLVRFHRTPVGLFRNWIWSLVFSLDTGSLVFCSGYWISLVFFRYWLVYFGFSKDQKKKLTDTGFWFLKDLDSLEFNGGFSRSLDF